VILRGRGSGETVRARLVAAGALLVATGLIVGCGDASTSTGHTTGTATTATVRMPASTVATTPVATPAKTGSKSAAAPVATGTKPHKCDAGRILCRAFGLLRRAAGSADVPRIKASAVPDDHLRLRLARRALRVGEKSLFLIPGRRVVCAYLGRGSDGGFACKPPSAAAKYGIQAGEFSAHGVTITQILPDGAHDIRLEMDGSKSRVLIMRNNAVAARIPGPPRVGAIIWSGRDGVEQTIPFNPGSAPG
jgi:hypothetical protein